MLSSHRRLLAPATLASIMALGLALPLHVHAEDAPKTEATSPTPEAAPATPASPIAPPPRKVDPKAKEVLDQMEGAYKKLDSFAVTMTAKSGPGEEAKTTIQFKKPKQIAVHTVAGKIEIDARSDGKQVYAFTSQDKLKFQKIATPDNFVETLNLALEAAGGGVGVIRLLLTGMDSLPPSTETVTVGDPGTVDGIPVENVISRFPGPNGDKVKLTYAVSKEDHLLRKIALEVEGKDQGFTETHSDLKVNPDFPASTFVYTPPAGAKEVKPDDMPQQTFYDSTLKPGVVPFAFDVKDVADKSVNLADYKGKVLLLDFWATWCGPCLQELPNVQKVYSQYKGKGFDILGISLDQDKEALGKFTKSHDMAWRQVFDLGNKDKGVALRYGVQAIPFALLIGKDGKIVALNLRGDDLEKAVKAAIAAK